MRTLARLALLAVAAHSLAGCMRFGFTDPAPSTAAYLRAEAVARGN